jgi:DNA-binding transcriptional regulator YiaG
MSKLEGVLKSEIVRLAKKEVRKISVPLLRDVRALRGTVSRLRKTVTALEKSTERQRRTMPAEKISLESSPEELKSARFSPRLIRTLRTHLGITQKELALLIGVTVGAIHQWESGKFRPRTDKKGMLAALRKMGRRDVKKLIQEQTGQDGGSSTPEVRRAKPRRPRRK